MRERKRRSKINFRINLSSNDVKICNKKYKCICKNILCKD